MSDNLAISLETCAVCIPLASVAGDTATRYGVALRGFNMAAVLVVIGCVMLANVSALYRSESLASVVALCCASVCAYTDIRTGYVFDRVLFLAGAFAVLASVSSEITQHLVGLLSGLALMGLPWCVTRGRGIGLGDVKLAAVLGLSVGARGIIYALLAAAISAGIFASGLLLMGKARRSSTLPFAPFLALGTYCALLGGTP